MAHKLMKTRIGKKFRKRIQDPFDIYNTVRLN